MFENLLSIKEEYNYYPSIYEIPNGNGSEFYDSESYRFLDDINKIKKDYKKNIANRHLSLIK